MPDIQRLITKAAKLPYRVLEEREFWTPEFCLAFYEWCAEEAYENPSTALIRAQIALELATKTGDSHSLAKAHCVMAAGFRRACVLERSDAELQIARNLAGSCPCCLADVYRCMGGLRLYQHRFNDAMTYFGTAIDHCYTLGNDDGVGRTLIWRSSVHWLSGDVDTALAEGTRALDLLSPDTRPFYYIAALTNIAAFLATGEDRHFVHASGFLRTLRNHLNGLKDFTAVRLCLSWTHGLILARLNKRNPAFQMLRKVRTRFLSRRQDAEVLAITADIALLYCETRKFHNLVHLIRDSLPLFADVGETHLLLKTILNMAERERAETWEHLIQLRATVKVPIPSLVNVTPSLEIAAAP